MTDWDDGTVNHAASPEWNAGVSQADETGQAPSWLSPKESWRGNESIRDELSIRKTGRELSRLSTGYEYEDMGRSDCSLCVGAGEIEEGCSCYQCEYDDSAHRYTYPCPDCRPADYERWERAHA